MKIVNLVKSEFLKNYSWKKIGIIVLVLFICSVVFVEINDFMMAVSNEGYYGYSSEAIEYEYNLLLQKENKTIEEQYNFYYFKVQKDFNEYVKEKNVKSRDWKNVLFHNSMLNLLGDNYIIALYQEHKEDDVIQYICSGDKTNHNSYFESIIHRFCTIYTEEELDSLYKENQEKINVYTHLLKEDKFYLYVQYFKDIGCVQDDKELEIVNLIIDQKIESMEDFRALNYEQFPFIKEELIEENNFIGSSANSWFPTYSDYVRYEKKFNQDQKAHQSILIYSTKHGIKHDLVYDTSYSYNTECGIYTYITSKTAVNLIFHFSIVVMIIVSITSSGIVSSEHSSGTIKNLITAPIKRWKILFSKFIYLIMHTYNIWLLALLILSLYAGFKYSFGDLIAPKLIYWNGKVVEINYYLYLLKDMFLASIPMIAFMSMLFFFSSVTLSTSLATGVSTVLSLLPLLLYYLCNNISSAFLIFSKTPFFYLDCGFIFGKLEIYMNFLKKADIRLENGIFVSLITIVVFYALSNYIYIKRDIKN